MSASQSTECHSVEISNELPANILRDPPTSVPLCFSASLFVKARMWSQSRRLSADELMWKV